MRDELLLDGKNCMETVEQVVEAVNPISKQKEMAQQCLSYNIFDEYDASEHIRVYELSNEVWRNNVRMISHHAESQDLTRFLHALNILCALSGFPPLYFTEPYSSISQSMKLYRESYQSYLDTLKAYLKKGGLRKNFLQTIDKSSMAQELKVIYRCHFLVTENLYLKFHISISSTFEELIVHGQPVRPDIFIWMPSKPQLNLIIECRSFDHTDIANYLISKAKDRVLREKGVEILCFSSSEIYDDPWKKAQELRDFLYLKLDELIKADVESSFPDLKL
jgi:hypothetical protein